LRTRNPTHTPAVVYNDGMSEQSPRRRRRDRYREMGSRYLAQAVDDLRFAELLLREEGYYLTANLSHQAAEKSLKAIHWLVRRAEPPWRHSLTTLVTRFSPIRRTLHPISETICLS
jgi:HEPN domain-containing protein